MYPFRFKTKVAVSFKGQSGTYQANRYVQFFRSKMKVEFIVFLVGLITVASAQYFPFFFNNGYGDNGHGNNGYGDNGYGDNGYGDNGYGHYGDNGDNGHGHYGYYGNNGDNGHNGYNGYRGKCVSVLELNHSYFF